MQDQDMPGFGKLHTVHLRYGAEAIVDYREAKQRNPRDVTPCLGSFAALTHEGRRDEAMVELHELESLNPDLPELKTLLKLLDAETDQADEGQPP